jgi:hypothetical protein
LNRDKIVVPFLGILSKQQLLQDQILPRNVNSFLDLPNKATLNIILILKYPSQIEDLMAASNEVGLEATTEKVSILWHVDP